ncbi:hypothetical protein AVEN_186748-1 [Araneus ventricosus]|uniref:Uncharacterized protein n=1 Tax=Araneus ventricosus TaxID=182803 RepID=A0A4Y2K2W1_ARAVE|nr:hypothetical protein AVEN_186748-1 [Araneus ventricosus]
MAQGPLVNYPLHADRKAFEISEIASKENVSLRKKFALKCIGGGEPGTWEVTLHLSKDLPFDNFKISASLKRADDGRNALNAYLNIMLANMQGKMCPLSYSMDHIFRGQETESKIFEVGEHFKCLFINENIHRDTLVVEIKLVVAGCQGQHKGFGVEVARLNVNGGRIEKGDGDRRLAEEESRISHTGRGGLVVRSRLWGRMVLGSKPDSTEDPPCMGPVAR